MTPASGDGPERARGAEPSSWLDVERWRTVPHRVVSVRRPTERSVVLGSTQPSESIDADAAAAAGVAVLRRRSGGGAVLVEPGGTLWVDAWVPADDPLADHDVMRASWWVGDWWARALASGGVAGSAVHRGRATRDAISALVCFAGRGPGEVTVGSRKVVGVAQWRCRQGALLQSLCYAEWDPAPLGSLLVVSPELRGAVRDVLPGAAAGVSELRRLGAGSAASDGLDLGSIETALLDTLDDGPWEVERPV